MAIARVLPPGSLSNFSRNTKGQAYGLNWDYDAKIPLVSQPLEALASSAIPKSSVLTGIDEVLDSFIIPAGTLGVRSVIQFEPVWTYSNSANNKTLKIKIGIDFVYLVTRTTSVKEAPLIVIANRNSLKSQINPYSIDTNYAVASMTAPAIYAIDFSMDNMVTFIGQRANASDTLTLEYYRVLHLVGN